MPPRAQSAQVATQADAKKDDAAYAVAKEKCDSLAGDAQNTCIQEARARHDQS